MRIPTLKLAVWGLLLLAASAVFAQRPLPFSADISATMNNGDKMTGKWYFTPFFLRFDVTSMKSEREKDASMSGKVSAIGDEDKETLYLLMPQQRMYMEFTYKSRNMPPGFRPLLRLRSKDDICAKDGERTCKLLGTETVDGRSCDKWEVTYKDNTKGILWIDQKVYFPIKLIVDDGMVIEFTNIKEGTQNPSLFKLPSGYKLFDLSAFEQRSPK